MGAERIRFEMYLKKTLSKGVAATSTSSSTSSAPSPDKKPVNTNPDEAEQAMKNTAKEVTKQIDNFQKKIARQNAASMGKIPDNVKKGK